MSWLLFTDKGERVPKISVDDNGGFAVTGWVTPVQSELHQLTNVFGFPDDREFRPTYFVAKMARGYRVFPLDVGVHVHVAAHELGNWWRCSNSDQKRLPTIAAVEMYLRMTA